MTAGTPDPSAFAALAAEDAACRAMGPDALPRRLRSAVARVRRAHRQLLTGAGRSRSGAVEWILDNWFAIAEGLQQVQQDLPSRFTRELPRRDSAPAPGLPRAWRLARAATTGSGGFLDLAQAAQAVEAYQRVAPLTIGELWALPGLFRLVVVEDLADCADHVANQLAAPAAGDLETRIAGLVTSLRRIATHDWKVFVERASRLEALLAEDPAAAHRTADFATRDRYRKVAEQLAREAGVDETTVARAAVTLSRAAPPGRARHIGYYLIDEGRAHLEQALGRRASPRVRFRRAIARHATAAYLGAIAGLVVALLTVPIIGMHLRENVGATVLVALLVLVPAIGIAVPAVNWLVTHLVPPRRLPRLDFDDGVAAECTTVVAVPTLLTSRADADAMLRQLEINYQGNADPAVRFALLLDGRDAATPERPEDAELLAAVTAGINVLNRRYGTDGDGPFLALYRPRRWNASEGCWMGWERKRGKLTEFNRLLLGDTSTGLTVHVGSAAGLANVRYVITLDADTVLPGGAAAHLIGALAHPLNQATFDEAGQVYAGYTVLQPRVVVAGRGAGETAFARVFEGDTGLDLYTPAISDAYHDVFGEGIFAGKGIYDVAAFERALAGRVPDNTLLSHDLFEGIHGRAGFISDVQFQEDYPSHVVGYARRLQRWIRGDWQLLPWLGRTVPLADGTRAPNPLSVMGRWKILDNLRRSLTAPTMLALLLVGWVLLPESAWFLTGIAAGTLGAPIVLGAATNANRIVAGAAWRPTVTTAIRSARMDLLRWLLALMLLAFEAAIALSAIGRTLFRLTVTHRQLLEWQPAALTARLVSQLHTARPVWRFMWTSPAIGAGGALLVAVVAPRSLPAALPFLLAWLAAPLVAHQMSRTYVPAVPLLSGDERGRLRRLARRTWYYFEHVLSPDNNWLPPDNIQESPVALVAHRTSPTNVGMGLLATLGAYDLGYLGLRSMTTTVGHTMTGLAGLERFRGHCFNWCDTQTGEVLAPRYISVVDSGNLAAALITLREACLDLDNVPILAPALWRGLRDTLDVFRDIVERLPVVADARRDLLQMVAAWQDQLRTPPPTPAAQRALADALRARELPALEASTADLVEATVGTLDAPSLRALFLWLDRVRYQLERMLMEFDQLAPWAAHVEQAPDAVRETLARWPTLRAAAALPRTLGPLGPETAFGRAITEGAQTARAVRAQLQQVASEAAQLVGDMDFRFLYDRHRRLFHIGYDVDAGRLDTSYYDLLASEARLASLVAIAKRDVPERHWLHLGRPLARASGRGGRVLLSWGGTMFEYLMPTLVAESPEQSLLTLGSRGAVRQQQRFGRRHGIPWGTSESAFHVLSSEGHYQYRAFGVPGLGLKRDLGDRLVVAPYASVLALPLAPGDVARNVEAIERLGGLGDYGLYEALDYGAPPAHDGPPAIVRAYMSHHQGMIMVALTNHLAGGTMVRRFHQDARIASVEYLLFEQSPHAAPLHRPERRPALRVGQPRRARYAAWPVDLAGAPHMHLLSNGRYHVLATSAGGGGSRWRGRALTRWRAESGANQWGHWCYLQDRDSGALWSAAQQPVHDVDTDAGVLFSASRVEYRVRAHDIATRMVVTVPPGDDLEVRRITLQNESGRVRRLTITAYCEIALARPADDLRHQAFSKLFVESEVLPAARTVLFRRRPGGPDPGELFLGQTLAVQGGRPVACSWETDRARFLGPAGPARRPAALIEGMPLGGDGGATVDPVAAFRCEVDVPAGGRVGLAFVTSVATTRAALLDRLEAYRSWSRIERAVEEAAVHADGELNALNVAVDEVRTIQRLFSAMLVPHANLRPTDALAAERGSQAELWRFGISGDKPIVLLRVVSDRDDTVTNVQTALRFRSLLKGRGCEMDLVLVDELSAGYHQPWHERLQALLREVDLEGHTGPVPGVYLLRGRELAPGDRQLLEAAARVVLDTGRSIAEQLTALDRPPGRLPAFAAHVAAPPDTALPPPPPPDLAFDNGAGGFSADGREYVVTLTPTTGPPRAWSHVVANAQFGFLASARGGGYTWSVNSAERRLTPWRNDPVTDAPGEVLYLRDEETGLVWSPAAQPAGRGHTHTARFGAGYVTYEAHHEQLAQTVRMFVAPDDPVKLIEVTLENLSARPRRLTATWYAEWVLGTSRHRTTPHLVPEYDALNGTLLARNPFHPAFAARTAFLTSGLPPHGLTTDRAEFIGERDNYRRPAALHRIGPSGAVRAGGDPCAALQVYVHVEPGERRTIHFAMGDGADRDHALALAKRYRDAGAVREAWSASAERWNHLLGAVQVRTPDPALDVLLNHWLLYQAMASRLWARTGLDQSGGAFGFRDQLQDVLALTHAAPALARAQLLEAARHQFAEGDVLHWWHPGADAGVRTRCSDDLLWLPYAAAHYVAATGDKGVLDEAVPFLVGEPLAKDEGDRYGHFPPSDQPASLYEHCVRALEYGHRPGVHGLPLFGAGDWNDGMNRVGAAGRGESVWLAWFFIATARAFLPLCERRGDGERAVILTRQADVMTRAVEEHAWDGGWYLRGYFDDGTPLGSQAAQECQLDAVAQSWAVISGAADPERARTAMHAVLDRLADKDLKLLRLFDPPFDRARQDPGYIRAYPPGVRENGGQYTHAALWTAWAVGLLGDGDQLGELLRWLNPVHRTSTPEGVAQYRGEPYVVAADISTNPYRPGAAGWTWYTGSASWMYRLGMEVLLGVRREGEMLVVNPCIPRAWDGFDVRWRVGRSVYHITVRNPEHVCRGVARMLVDGVPLDGVRIPLRDDGAAHEVEVVLGGRG